VRKPDGAKNRGTKMISESNFLQLDGPAAVSGDKVESNLYNQLDMKSYDELIRAASTNGSPTEDLFCSNDLEVNNPNIKAEINGTPMELNSVKLKDDRIRTTGRDKGGNRVMELITDPKDRVREFRIFNPLTGAKVLEKTYDEKGGIKMFEECHPNGKPGLRGSYREDGSMALLHEFHEKTGRIAQEIVYGKDGSMSTTMYDENGDRTFRASRDKHGKVTIQEQPLLTWPSDGYLFPKPFVDFSKTKVPKLQGKVGGNLREMF
ncbi:MAG: hypothetical protein K2Z81_11260, partial [Cyanobacteria bacterium]|nr:hypothetical protein [Cyanobacteriota bacterium]